MNRYFYIGLILSCSIPLHSCQREAIHKTHPEFIGSWYHRDPTGEHWHLDMNEKSWGTITVYDSFKKVMPKYGENPRRWRYNEKRKELTNGIISDRFKVNQLPTVATDTIIHGLDTIPAGRSYFIMDDDYYLKK